MALTKISTDGVKDDAVTAGKIPANAVGSSELADNAVDTAAIADDAVTAAKIANNTITATQLNTDAVDTDALQVNSVTTAKIADDAVTADKLADNTVGTSNIVDQTVTLAKLPHGDGSSNGKFLRANNGADPTFETVNTDLVADTSPQLGGNLASNGNSINMADNDEIVIGSSNDLILRHIPGSRHEILGAASAPLHVRCDDQQLLSENGSEYLVRAVKDGAVEAYHDGTKRLETTGGGVKLTSGGSTPIITNTSSPVYTNAGLELHRGGNGYCNVRFASNYGVTMSLAGIGNSSTTEFSLLQDNGGNAYVRNESTSPMRFQIGSSGLSSTNTMVMNNGGEVQVPRQPFFWAYNSSDYSWNNNTISFETEFNDVGGNYNNSTYTFTCPIAGVYMFVVYFRAGGGFGEFSWTLQKNGGNFIRIIGQGSFSGNDCHFGTTIQGCSVNDTFRVHGSGSHGGATGGYPYNGFQGYLLG